MTREQAVRRAILEGLLQNRAFVVVEERFRSHKPSYHLLDLPTWRLRKRSRQKGEPFWAAWFEVWPADEGADG